MPVIFPQTMSVFFVGGNLGLQRRHGLSCSDLCFPQSLIQRYGCSGAVKGSSACAALPHHPPQLRSQILGGLTAFLLTYQSYSQTWGRWTAVEVRLKQCWYGKFFVMREIEQDSSLALPDMPLLRGRDVDPSYGCSALCLYRQERTQTSKPSRGNVVPGRGKR